MHNETNARVCWWFSFIFLCGIIACCISGLAVASRFGKYIKVTKCAYERIYYDSEFGQLTDSSPKWEGFQYNSEKLKKLRDTISNITNIPQSKNDKNSDSDETSPTISPSDSSSDIQKNINDIKEKMEKLISHCREISENHCGRKNIYLSENGSCGNILIFEYNKPDNPSSIVGRFQNELNNLNNLLRLMINQYEEIEESVGILSDFGDIFIDELNTSANNFDLISQDLKNYKSGYLDEVDHYAKIAKGWGYILVIIYLSLLCFFSVCGCILLLVYSYLTNQGNLGTLMHIIWNLIHFFSISFFIYGAAFGMLYNGLRDLIAYNEFLFGENLKPNITTYLLPRNESKVFLDFCLTEEKAEFTDVVDEFLSENLDSVYTNYINLNETLKKINVTNVRILKDFKKDNSGCCKEGGLRNNEDSYFSSEPVESEYEESESVESTEPTSDSSYNYNITLPIEVLDNLVNLTKKVLEKYKDLFVFDFGETITRRLSLLTSFDCGFLKNDLKLIYNSLYDLSIESRILCVLSCCIGFFGEILVHFYLLSMYHYDTEIFKEGSLSMNRSKNRQNQSEKSELNSRNEFLSKNNPYGIKKLNKKLDQEYH